MTGPVNEGLAHGRVIRLRYRGSEGPVTCPDGNGWSTPKSYPRWCSTVTAISRPSSARFGARLFSEVADSL